MEGATDPTPFDGGDIVLSLGNNQSDEGVIAWAWESLQSNGGDTILILGERPSQMGQTWT